MMLGAGQILTPVKDTITLGDDHIQLPRWAAAGPLPHLRPPRHFSRGILGALADLMPQSAAVNIATLATEYHAFSGCAPKRSGRGKAYFVGHTGSTPAAMPSNRREEHLARLLCDRSARWPWPGGGWLRPLDYQFPLKARQTDAGLARSIFWE